MGGEDCARTRDLLRVQAGLRSAVCAESWGGKGGEPFAVSPPPSAAGGELGVRLNSARISRVRDADHFQVRGQRRAAHAFVTPRLRS